MPTRGSLLVHCRVALGEKVGIVRPELREDRIGVVRGVDHVAEVAFHVPEVAFVVHRPGVIQMMATSRGWWAAVAVTVTVVEGTPKISAKRARHLWVIVTWARL